MVLYVILYHFIMYHMSYGCAEFSSRVNIYVKFCTLDFLPVLSLISDNGHFPETIRSLCTAMSLV